MVGREIPLIAFDGYYPRFMGYGGIMASSQTNSPAEQKQCRALVSRTEVTLRP